MKSSTRIANQLSRMALSLILSVSAVSGATIRFNQANFSPTNPTPGPQTPKLHSYLIPLAEEDKTSDLKVTIYGDRVIGQIDQTDHGIQTTSDDPNRYSQSRPYLNLDAQPISVAGEVVIEHSRFAEILATPEWTDSVGQIHRADSVDVLLTTTQISSNNLIDRASRISVDSRQISSTRIPGLYFRDIAPVSQFARCTDFRCDDRRDHRRILRA